LTESIILGLAGLFLGRLLNLTIDWLPPPRASAGDKSRCDGRHSIGLIHLAPLISYLWRRGRCPTCRRQAPVRWVAVEAITALVCGLIGFQYGLTLRAAVLIFYCALFIHLAFVDLEHSLILNKVVLPALPVALALFPFSPLGQSWGIGEAYLRSLSGLGLGFGLMLLVYLASRGGTGAGDVKLAALLGAMLGFPQIAAGLPLGFILGGLAGVALLALRLKHRSDAIPYGPALIIGAAAVLLGGPGVYGWYLDLFR
jgi:leader peptidase (prepilin peptidase)/N-methyltransferase